MTITERVAYLKGLVEGLGLEDSKEGRIIKAIVEVLDDLALTVSDLEDGVSEVSEQVDAIDEDLEDLEKDFYGEDEDEDEDYDDEEEYCQISCPKCGDTIYLDEELLSKENIVCPNCSEEFEIECQCDCCHDDED